MALPKINELPSYTLTIPSTAKKIKFRPFLTKEQKILLMALETQDQEKILNAITDIIESCVVDNVDVGSLTTFDVEYIFTQIRAKSVGEKSKVGLICVNCEHTNQVTVDLEKIKVEVPKKDTNIVRLNEVYTLKLKYPNYKFMLSNEKLLNPESYTEAMLELVIGSLESLQTEEENISFANEPRADIEKFIDNLTSQQFNNVMEFINNIPKLQHKINFKCTSCGHDNTSTLQGINDFF